MGSKSNCIYVYMRNLAPAKACILWTFVKRIGSCCSHILMHIKRSVKMQRSGRERPSRFFLYTKRHSPTHTHYHQNTTTEKRHRFRVPHRNRFSNKQNASAKLKTRKKVSTQTFRYFVIKFFSPVHTHSLWLVVAWPVEFFYPLWVAVSGAVAVLFFSLSICLFVWSTSCCLSAEIFNDLTFSSCAPRSTG